MNALDESAKQSIKQSILLKLQAVIEPTWGISIVDCGLIYGIDVNEASIITIKMTLLDKESPSHHALIEKVRTQVEQVPDIEGVDIELVFEPTWTFERMSLKGRKQTHLLFLGAPHES